MADRTWVEVTVAGDNAGDNQSLQNHATFCEFVRASGPEEVTTDGLLTVFYYPEVNYGELKELSILEKAGISYDSHYGGFEYQWAEGTKAVRFTSEGRREWEVSVNDHFPLEEVEAACENALREGTLEAIKQLQVEVELWKERRVCPIPLV
jgi:hypothetical protein